MHAFPVYVQALNFCVPAQIHEFYHASGGLVDGYAPFCKHLFCPNFVGAKVRVAHFPLAHSQVEVPHLRLGRALTVSAGARFSMCARCGNAAVSQAMAHCLQQTLLKGGYSCVCACRLEPYR